MWEEFLFKLVKSINVLKNSTRYFNWPRDNHQINKQTKNTSETGFQQFGSRKSKTMWRLKTSKFGRHRLSLIVFFFNAFYMWGCHVKEIRADAHTTDHPLPQIHGSNSKQFRQNNCWGMLSCWSPTRPPNISLLIFEFTLETQILVTWLGQWATCDDPPPGLPS